MKRFLYPILVIILVLITVSCAPKQAPAPATPATRPSTPAPAATPASNLLPPTSQDAAWAKVVENAKKEGSLTIYSFYYVGDIGRAIAKAFQDRYGIRVEIMAAPGRQTVEKLKVEQSMKQVVADVVNTGVSSSTEISLAGIGESVWRELPNLKNKDVFNVDPVYSPNGDILFFSLTLIGPLINTSLIKTQDEPKSLMDFLDPKWKGNIIAIDPRQGGGGLFNMITVMKYFKVMEDDYWRKLAPNLTLFGGSQQEAYRATGRGEYKVCMPASDSPIAPLIAEGAPLKLLAIDEGTVGQGEATMVVKGAPHPNAARLFTDWVFSQEGQTVYAKASSINPLRKDIPGFLIAGANLTPKKILNRTWDAAAAGNDYQKAGLIEQLFGKR